MNGLSNGTKYVSVKYMYPSVKLLQRQSQILLDTPYPKRAGPKRKTTTRDDKLIKRTSIIDLKLTAADISRKIKDENGIEVSRWTVGRRLRAEGLY